MVVSTYRLLSEFRGLLHLLGTFTYTYIQKHSPSRRVSTYLLQPRCFTIEERSGDASTLTWRRPPVQMTGYTAPPADRELYSFAVLPSLFCTLLLQFDRAGKNGDFPITCYQVPVTHQ
ncbi:unnamed protein product [Nesidiocoris tenuis]|uniref:Uncharacterized protein n=1 Tax=Nesidiocoris tenuis TaxID=355587 RepID=A0A6H5HQD6_9HEMI|nr:unnamed protein product [Nesidiocoris tenuis]